MIIWIDFNSISPLIKLIVKFCNIVRNVLQLDIVQRVLRSSILCQPRWHRSTNSLILTTKGLSVFSQITEIFKKFFIIFMILYTLTMLQALSSNLTKAFRLIIEASSCQFIEKFSIIFYGGKLKLSRTNFRTYTLARPVRPADQITSLFGSRVGLLSEFHSRCLSGCLCGLVEGCLSCRVLARFASLS